MERISLEVTTRNEFGKGHAGRLRRAGFIPAIVYGKETDPISVSVEEKTLRSALRKGLRLGRLVELAWSDDHAPAVALLREVQKDPVTSRPVHLDFQVVLATQPLIVEVPVELKGTPVGVREESGHLEQHVWRARIRCLPGQIPDTLILDVTELHAGSTLHVSDIGWTDGAILTDATLAVATVARPRIEAPAAEAVEGEEGAPAAEEGPAAEDS
ncbi:MAG: 50S ribosomal protein L25 [Candidatus Eisenbacteria bacterium]|jgi:large subunit ribosomal protein L25|nr:50S ribosomal protein L25 [Candidatus Eisenbacteria bacterium]